MSAQKPLTIVEAAMEIAYENQLLSRIAERHKSAASVAAAMSSSVGGIGPLLNERIAAQAKLGAKVVGVTLLYDHVWVQGFHSWGQIFIEKKQIGPIVREFLEPAGCDFSLTMPDATSLAVKVWKTPVGAGEVFLLDVPHIADVVYPGPEDAARDHPNPQAWADHQRFLQHWLIGRGTLQLLKKLNLQPDVIVQSETPTFFANHKLVQDEFQRDPFFASTKYVFNDHTPLEYAHPHWDKNQIARAKLDPELAARRDFWTADGKAVDVTRILISESDATFGVSKKHGVVMRAMPSLKGLESKIDSITNGVSVERWQEPRLGNAENLGDNDLLTLKEKLKSELILWVWKRYRLWYDWKNAAQNQALVLWTRRVTSYKRFDVLEKLLLDAKMRERFLRTQITVLVGGRLHQNDDISQNIVFRLLDLVNSDKTLSDRVVVLDNYNIWDAPKLFSGVDATIMLADDGREASATGFMKAQLNGAAVLGSSDGAVPESVQFAPPAQMPPEVNGIEVPYVQGEPTPEGLLLAFERFDQIYKNPAERAGVIRAALRVKPQVSVDRTAREMIGLFKQLRTT